MKTSSIGIAAALLALASCSQEPSAPHSGDATQALPDRAEADQSGGAEGGACADGGPRLGFTGLCQDAAARLLLAKASAAPGAPDGCAWRVGETELAGGDALLYRALQCGGKTAELRFAPTVQRGDLELVSSAMDGKLAEPRLIGFLSTIDGDGHGDGDGAGAVSDLARAAMTDKAGAATCAARPAKVEGWPTDALVVDTNPAGSVSRDGDPVSVCGDLGYFDEATKFWRVSQHTAWFFDFGQDLVEIDPGTVTLVSQADGGAWQPQ